MSDVEIPRGSSTPRGRKRRVARAGRRALSGFFVLLVLLLPVALWLGAGKFHRILDERNLFALHDLRITGVHCADSASLSEAMDSLLGQPLGSLGPESVARAAERDPWIISIQLRRLWPNRAEIRVLERRPAALLATSGGLRCLSEDGRVLPMPAARSLDLPLVTAPHGVPLAEAPAIASTINRLRQVSPDVFSRLDQMSWRDDPRLILRDLPLGIVITRDHLEHGLSLLESVIRERPALLQSRGEMDLRFTNQVILRRNDV